MKLSLNNEFVGHCLTFAPHLTCVLSLLSLVNVMRCSVCHQDYKQSDIIDNYFVKDTTEATSTSDEKAAQVCQNVWWHCTYTSVSTLGGSSGLTLGF